ncbi:TPA: hypothetical protein L3M66_001216 [Vibrio parahaemolyticus]|uniref:hypothetical protein n=1 Tax=Vibrio parahaemolyticus TaxID=670 RepID=UPI00387B55BA|nr:hypothetical protein [Vibrio parahaemolyticus]
MISNYRKLWKVNYKGCSVFGYIIANVEGKRVTRFSPKIRLSIKDIEGFLRFLSIPFLNDDTVVVCIPDRKDLHDFVEQYFQGKKLVKFVRAEVGYGNSFLIEALRKLSRLIFKFFLIPHKNRLIKELGLEKNKIIKNDIESFLGDYYFNKIIALFFKNKKVYYSNCVVPKIEKYMGLMNSTEIQHGVIYKDHFDYANMDRNYLYGKFLAWNKYWADILRNECNYPLPIEHGSFTGELIDLKRREKGILILTTVSEEFSINIINYFNFKDVTLRKHPRDYFPYKQRGFVGKVENYTPLAAYDKIVCSDTTIIKSLVDAGYYFSYLGLSSESDVEINIKLREKYQAELNVNYEII